MCIFICQMGIHDRLWIFGIIGEIQIVHVLIHPVYDVVLIISFIHTVFRLIYFIMLEICDMMFSNYIMLKLIEY